MRELLKDVRTRFIVGMAMAAAGLWMFIQKIYVSSNFFSMGIKVGSFHIHSGILIVPLIAGLIWLFFKPKKMMPKILSIAGAVIIVIYAISSVNIRVSRISLLAWIFMLFLIITGTILLLSAIHEKNK